ncbi:MAG: ATP-binding cassette domain-containing protein [Anaerolineae bacterium]|nr:ATP-binding cassette domain-containing protein [Anaerolineae bacterium]
MRGSRRQRRRPEEDIETPDAPVNWRRLIGYLRPYLGFMIIGFIALMASAGLSLVFPSVIQRVVDTVLQARDSQLLDQLVALLLGVFALQSLTTLVETYFINLVGERIVLDLRSDTYRHLQHLSLGFFAERRIGELVSRLTSDVTAIRGVLTTSVNTLIQQSFILVGAVAIMIALNWRLTVFIAVLIPVLLILGFGFGIALRRGSQQIQDELAEANTVANETIQSIREVKTFVREDYEFGRYHSAITRAFRAAIKVLRIRSVLGPITAFAGFGSIGAVLWFGGREALEGRLTGGELVAFLVYGGTVAASLGSLVGLYTEVQSALGASKRIFQILDTPPSVTDAPDARTLTGAQGRITFDHVAFSYDTRQSVLHDINLDIAPGEILALVGPSGAGKSTVFNLIPRFYDPSAGQICLDGVDLRTVTQKSLREQIAIVPQETLLFGGSVYENIRYGRLEASEAEVKAAAQAANAHDFIMSFPDQYQTVVGERGVKLSGGQRQRIAIARALLKDPRILLLDEATSSLDSESEHEVQEALTRLMQGRTTVIIAHRLSTINVAHRIAVLEKGSLIELGSHAELIARGGLYARLYAMQFRDEIKPEAALTAK